MLETRHSAIQKGNFAEESDSTDLILKLPPNIINEVLQKDKNDDGAWIQAPTFKRVLYELSPVPFQNLKTSGIMMILILDLSMMKYEEFWISKTARKPFGHQIMLIC